MIAYKEKKLAEDNLRIDTEKEIELRYWSVVLKTNPAELKAAVKKAGTAVAAVKQLLNPRGLSYTQKSTNADDD